MRIENQSKRSATAAFTLVEVILAISIALGILVVLLFFYQQATNLRAMVLEQTDRITAARLLMERITSELRTSQFDAGFTRAFLGSSNSLEFVKAEVPSFSAWTGGALGRSAYPVSDLKRISYRLEMSMDTTNVAGVLRAEEPLVPRQSTFSTEEPASSSGLTNSPAALMEEIRYLQFRYWSGTNWVDSWTAGGAPAGVEVSLGSEPITSQTDTNEYSGEIFRRVIYLPVNQETQSATSSNKFELTTGAPEDNP
jgi:type II secretory pathway pseudopilin PulG